MQVYVNEKHIVNRAKWGRRTSLIGLTILGIGMVASFSPNYIARLIAEGNEMAKSPLVQWVGSGGWFYIAMISLLGGFILGQIGNQSIRRFQRSPRPDQVVAQALKGFDDRNHLYIWATPGDMVFAGPTGVYTIATCDVRGQATVINDRIQRPFNWRRVLSFGQDNPGQPGREAQDAAAAISKWLTSQVGGSEPIPVNPLVVFTDDNAKLDVQSASAPMIHYKQLKDYLRGQVRNSTLGREALKAIIDSLDAEAKRRGVQPEG